ncbi:NAD(P)H dehydrogenase (quinone)s, partial [Striga asiatica]
MAPAMAITGFAISSYSVPRRRTPPLTGLPNSKRLFLVNVKCELESSQRRSTCQTESETASYLPLSQGSSSTSAVDEGDLSISAYKWCAALGGIGFLETAAMAYLKLSGSDILRTMGGGNCSSILTSEFSSLFGVPLPLFGMAAYGIVSMLSLQLQLNHKKRAFDFEYIDSEMILIGTTTSMAFASAYFLYIMSTEFVGERCLYCLASAALSISLFFITLKSLGLGKIQKILGSQLCIASLAVIALTASYDSMQLVPSSLAATEMPFVEIKITQESNAMALSLAKHLHSIGAKLYGAFWCSHCVHQKQMFGLEASELLDYVECFPDGVGEGADMAKACYDINLKGLPSWEINGQVLIGEKQLPELARLSGIKLEDLNQ